MLLQFFFAGTVGLCTGFITALATQSVLTGLALWPVAWGLLYIHWRDKQRAAAAAAGHPPEPQQTRFWFFGWWGLRGNIVAAVAFAFVAIGLWTIDRAGTGENRATAQTQTDRHAAWYVGKDLWNAMQRSDTWAPLPQDMLQVLQAMVTSSRYRCDHPRSLQGMGESPRARYGLLHCRNGTEALGYRIELYADLENYSVRPWSELDWK